MFIGRKKELQLLNEELTKDRCAVLIYGKRKVGKTTLVKKALETSSGISVYYECIKATLEKNLEGFQKELFRCGVVKARIRFDSFIDAFQYLDDLGKTLNVVIDEYPYLKIHEDADMVDSVFQSIIDNSTSHIRLIMSGSHIGMMKDMLREENALYGRFSRVVKLRELSYLECAGFYPDCSDYDKVAYFAVFGGSPFINMQLDAGKSLRDNIICTILNDGSSANYYATQMLLSDYSAKTNAEQILATLGNGKKHYREIENSLRMDKTGYLNRQLKQLLELETISRRSPINRPDDPKKTTYEIEDNLLRFYFTFVFPERNALQMLGPEAFYDAYVGPGITDFISRRFEDICRSWFSILAGAGKLPGLRNIGTYYYDDTVRRKNGEFDIALEFSDGITILEAKYLKKPMQLSMIHHEAGQIRDIREFSPKQIGFISANGFESKEEGFLYYDAEDIYSPIEWRKASGVTPIYPPWSEGQAMV